MLILSLETSTHVCSVALHSNGIVLAYSEILIDKSHAEKITILIQQVCEEAKTELSAIDGVAISKGPGSYTGLRIASSTAKGLCFALDKPLISVDTLQSMALEVAKSQFGLILANSIFSIVPMIDARRMEVFTCLYNAQAQKISEVEAKIVEENAFSEELENTKLIFCGNGADKCRPIITHSNAFFIDDIYPKATYIGYLASEKFSKNEFENVVNFEPFYLKEFYMQVN